MSETKNYFIFITTLIKILGHFPVTEKNNRIEFRWNSFKTFYSFVFFLISLINLTLNIYENQLGNLILVVDATGLAIQLSLFITAKHWPELVKECDKFDFYMKYYNFARYLKLKLYAVCVVLTVVALILYYLLEVTLSNKSESEEYTFSGVLKAATKSIIQDKSFPAFCSALLFIARKVSHLQIVVLRSCVDIFIITASVILSERFRQIVDQLGILVEKQIQCKNLWRQIREDYQRFCMFSEKWNNILGYLILSSFASNIYLILLQISNILSVSEMSSLQLYLILLCLDCLFRCITICYTAGNIYAEGTKLIQFLFLARPHIFNTEMERIIVQVRQARPALTSKQLFTLKHSLIFQIFGVILSHGVILIQYNKPLVANE